MVVLIDQIVDAVKSYCKSKHTLRILTIQVVSVQSYDSILMDTKYPASLMSHIKIVVVIIIKLFIALSLEG